MNYTTCKENSIIYKNHFEQQTRSKTMRKNNHGLLMFAHMTHVVKEVFKIETDPKLPAIHDDYYHNTPLYPHLLTAVY